MKRSLVVAWLAVASLAVPMFGVVSTAHAGATATEVVKNKQTALFDLLKQSGSTSQSKITATFDEMLDYSALAEASLGNEWQARSAAERTEFTDLLKQLVRRAYERNLKKTLGFEIQYLGEENAGSTMVVKTKAVSRTNVREEPIEISYKMLDKQGNWKIQDILTEGVSLVSSYRTQFTKVVKKDGFPRLIVKMKDKLAKGDV